MATASVTGVGAVATAVGSSSLVRTLTDHDTLRTIGLESDEIAARSHTRHLKREDIIHHHHVASHTRDTPSSRCG